MQSWRIEDWSASSCQSSFQVFGSIVCGHRKNKNEEIDPILGYEEPTTTSLVLVYLGQLSPSRSAMEAGLRKLETIDTTSHALC